MTILLPFLIGFGAFLVASVALVRRSERRLGGGDPHLAQHAPLRAADDPVSTYLDRMSVELRLPAADVAEVRAELADHLADSIASLQAEGLETEGAIREALARLGSADELARQLRAAHQSTRRLLAGVGGGVFAAAGGFVIGYLGGSFVVLLLAMVVFIVAALLTAVGVPLPDLSGGDSTGGASNSILIALSAAIAAGVAARYAVRTSAGLSRHAPRSVAGFWAVALGLAFGAYALFGVRGPQSWPGVVAEAFIPVVAVAAALVRIDRPMPHVARWALVAGLVATVGSVAALSLVSVSSVSSINISHEIAAPEPSDMHFDAVAPMAPATWLPAGSLGPGGWGTDETVGTRISAFWVNPQTGAARSEIASLLARWRDVRFEAWHTTRPDQPDGMAVDTRYSSPFAVQPAAITADSLEASFHFERMRSARAWTVFITAIGPDGVRYRLLDCGGGAAPFNGSAWDWLTAAQ